MRISLNSTPVPNNLRLGIDFIAGESWTGGLIYIQNLIYCLASLPDNERPQVSLLGVADPDNSMVRELLKFDFVQLEPPLKMMDRRATLLWWKIRRRYLQGILPSPRAWREIQATYPTFGKPLGNAVDIHWIPDFQERFLPHLFTEEDRQARAERAARLAASRCMLVFSSADAKGNFAKFYPQAICDVRVWQFCTVLSDIAQNNADPRQTYNLPKKYVYLPNQFWAHKNHITAFRAIAKVMRQFEDIALVCTGLEKDYRDPDHITRLRAFVQDNGLSDRIHTLGLVPRADQIQIFRYAALVIQPSLFEGWSTVVEDVKAIGRPFLVSDLPVHREQLPEDSYPNVMRFFPPLDDQLLADQICDLWPHLTPGPDVEREAAAYASSLRRRVDAGQELMSIVRQAMALGRR